MEDQSSKKDLVGESLLDLPTPVAVVDRSIVKRNCEQMLEACNRLGVAFRPHTKTHKTVEVTRLQVGKQTLEIYVIVSTLPEAELLEPFLLESRQNGKAINLLYGLPAPPSSLSRLAKIGRDLGHGSISILVDHPDQLNFLHKFEAIAGFGPEIYFKIDSGYHRAGLPPEDVELKALITATLKSEAYNGCTIRGFYSHAGHSYAGVGPSDSMTHLLNELFGLQKAATTFRQIAGQRRHLILSVGATPSATSIQNIPDRAFYVSVDPLPSRLVMCIQDLQSEGHTVELHAGVYPFLDMQQLHTQAAPSAKPTVYPEELTEKDIALSIIAEVASIYPHRKPPEALIAAGCLALGREPCAGYGGWGIVSDWEMVQRGTTWKGGGTTRSGWEVTKVSQEHGLLRENEDKGWSEGEPTEWGEMPWRVGQKVRIWPNHACVAGAGFPYYVVVDKNVREGMEVVDVWVRCRGW